MVKPKHVGAFIVNLNVNLNILKQFKCALVGQIKDLITIALPSMFLVLLLSLVSFLFGCCVIEVSLVSAVSSVSKDNNIAGVTTVQQHIYCRRWNVSARCKRFPLYMTHGTCTEERDQKRAG